MRPPPAELGLPPFYKKYCRADGIPILASSRVTDAAFAPAYETVRHLVATRPDVRDQLIRHHARVVLLAASESLADLPESDDHSVPPGLDWNLYDRAAGAIPERPLTVAAEENLLCRAAAGATAPAGSGAGEDLLVHALAHTIHKLGLSFADPQFDDDLAAAYADAMRAGRFKYTYAAVDKEEYFAEGVQDWWGANQRADPPDGRHNAVHTRAELLAYDPKLYRLIAGAFADGDWLPYCFSPAASPSPPSAPPPAPACQRPSTTPARLEFINDGRAPVTVYWVDFNCHELAYSSIAPLASAVYPTFAGHTWRVRDPRNGQLLKELVAGSVSFLTVHVE